MGCFMSLQCVRGEASRLDVLASRQNRGMYCVSTFKLRGLDARYPLGFAKHGSDILYPPFVDGDIIIACGSISRNGVLDVRSLMVLSSGIVYSRNAYGPMIFGSVVLSLIVGLAIIAYTQLQYSISGFMNILLLLSPILLLTMYVLCSSIKTLRSRLMIKSM